MNFSEIKNTILSKKSLLCIGLDSDRQKIPYVLSGNKNPVFDFNKAIIDSTKDLAIAYKLNTAFYESEGIEGWENLKRTIDYIPDDCFVIADAKRADIGNTSKMYAKTFFEYFNSDAITASPYMGKDSVEPFLEYKNKWTILLALTSNSGSKDFQYIEDQKKIPLYQNVLETSKKWGNPENMMYVVGATHPDEIKEIRKIIPDHFLLIPGIGTQGGDLDLVLKYGINSNYGLMVNVSRSIIFASSGPDFAEAARVKAFEYKSKMASIFSSLN